MNHDHKDHIAVDTSSISDMEAMWFLMIVMFGWNLWMAIQHYKLSKKVTCTCKKDN